MRLHPHSILLSTTLALAVAGCGNGGGGGVTAPTPSETLVIASRADDGSLPAFSSYDASLSANGRFVVLRSLAALSPTDVKGGNDIYIRDMVAERTLLASGTLFTQSNGNDLDPAISGDGFSIAWSSAATNLVVGDTNGVEDIYRRERTSGSIDRISISGTGVEPNGKSIRPRLSADGSQVVFESVATNLVSPDPNGSAADIFHKNLATGVLTRISQDASGAGGNLQSVMPSISSDGNVVAFASSASNLVPSDGNSTIDVFVKIVSTGAISRVSVAHGGGDANNLSGLAEISGNGRYVSFTSLASNLLPPGVDTNESFDVFVHDRVTGITTRESVSSAGVQANGESRYSSISADGRYVAFASTATNLVANDTNGVDDVFVRDRVAGTTVRVSVSASGRQATAPCITPFISGDGLKVSFHTASALLPADTNGQSDVYVQTLTPSGSG